MLYIFISVLHTCVHAVIKHAENGECADPLISFARTLGVNKLRVVDESTIGESQGAQPSSSCRMPPRSYGTVITAARHQRQAQSSSAAHPVIQPAIAIQPANGRTGLGTSTTALF